MQSVGSGQSPQTARASAQIPWLWDALQHWSEGAACACKGRAESPPQAHTHELPLPVGAVGVMMIVI